MLQIAELNKIDVHTKGIPISIFVAAWEARYNIKVPTPYLEEMMREYKDGLPVLTAIDYWASIAAWFIDQFSRD
jgi:hypothetical protein